MSYTKCKLYVDAIKQEKLNIGPKNEEEFCFIPKKVFVDGLGMTSTGKLVIPTSGEYRISVSAQITGGSANDFLHFGIDVLGIDNETSAGKYDDYLRTSVHCDGTGNGAEMYGSVTNVASFNAGQVIGAVYMRGSINTVNIKACCPMITIEKIG